MPHSALSTAFADYRQRHPNEAGSVDLFIEFLLSERAGSGRAGSDSAKSDSAGPGIGSAGNGLFLRSHPSGHFTGSAWLVSADGERVLLTHHRKLGLWLQPGGHADGDIDLARVALREAQEETGVAGLRLPTRAIFDLDRHRIPARRDEPDHYHYDVRYVVRAGADESFVVSEESHALAWRAVRDVAADTGADESVRRMAMKWLQRPPGGFE